MKAERRRFRRVRAAVLYRIPEHSVVRRRARDLSFGGVRVFSDERLDAGQTLELEFVLPNGIPISAAAKVVWIKKQPPGSAGVYDVGMELIHLTEVAREKLAAVLKKN